MCLSVDDFDFIVYPFERSGRELVVAMAVILFLIVLFGNKENAALAMIIQYRTSHTDRLWRHPSDEPLCGAHSLAATDPTEVLEASSNYLGILAYPSIYRMTQNCQERISSSV